MSFRTLTVCALSLIALGAVLSVAAPFVASGWIYVAVAFSSLAATASATLALRALRNRVAVTEFRQRSLTSRFEEQARAIESLERAASRTAIAVAILGADVKADGGILPQTAGVTARAEDLIAALDRLIEAGDVLEADRVARVYGITGDLPLRVLQLMARGLRDRGYLVRAMDYFTAAAAGGQERDAEMLRLRQAEIDVMSGAFRPVVGERVDVEVVPGRVLHVVGRALPTTQSGYTLRTHNTARAQASVGLEPHVFVQLGVTDTPPETPSVIDGVTYHRAEGTSIFQSGHVQWLQDNTAALLRVVEEVRPSVLHAHSDFLNALIAAAVGEATGIPVVYEARGFWEESWLSRTCDKYGWADPEAVFQRHGTPEAYAWRQRREEEARARVDHVVTLARVMADQIIERGVDPARVTLVPNAVDPELFSARERDTGLAVELGIPADAVVVGTITSVVEYEGLDLLVRSFADLQDAATSPIHLLVVGDGPELAGLRALASDLGLANATFTGRVPHHEVTRYYSLLDVFAVPRRPSAVSQLVTPLKPFEALAAGKALLVSDVSALREIAEDSGAATTFEAGNVASLTAALQRLVNDSAYRTSLAVTGAAWVQQNRTWTANANIYASLYADIVAPPVSPEETR